MANEFGEAIRLFREEKGWTQKELGERLGLTSVSSVSNWEAGVYKPDLDRFIEICQALQVSPGRLLGMSDERIYLSDIEEMLIRRFRLSDAEGQGEIMEVSQRVMERCGYYSNGKPVEVSFPLFILPGDPDYGEIRNGYKELRKMRRKNRVSYEAIFLHLARLSPIYDSHLCIAYIMAIFRGARCPSRELYNRIYAFLATQGDHRSEDTGEQK